MLHRFWLSTVSLIMLCSIGCPSPPAVPREHAVPAEATLRAPGSYTPQEIDRGSLQPKPSSQDILAGLPLGRVLFACASVMRVKAPERVEVRISNNTDEDLAAGLQDRGVPIEANAKIAPVMKVTLTPDEEGMFDVKSLSESEQLTNKSGFSQWVWSITPLKSGTHKIYLTVNAVVNVPGLGLQKREIPVLTQAVQVRADLGYSAGEFLRNNWQWSTTTLLIPLGLWFWRKGSKPEQ